MAQIYSVTYYKNDGSGTSLNYSEAEGPPLDQITSVGYNWDQFSPDPQGYDWSRSGYTFVEWNTSADGTGTSYAPGAMNYPYTLSIYAIWQAAVVTPDITISYNSATIATMSASGTEVLETDGTYMADDITIEYNKPSFSLQAKTGISPSTSSQTITPDSGYDGLSSVQIDAMPIMTLPSTTSSTALGTQRAAISPSTSTTYLNIPIGYSSPRRYYTLNAMPSGSATTPATTITANPSISVSNSGLITATASATQSVTPTVSAGYVSSGTAGTITVSGSNTSQLTTQAATTYTPTTSNQTIASGRWLTGTQTILGDANLLPENIAEGVTIFGVTGTHSGGGSVNILTLYVQITSAIQGTLYVDSGLTTPFNIEYFDYDYRAAYEYVASFDFIKIIGVHTTATNDRSYMLVDCVFLDPIDDTLQITASYKGTRKYWYL